MLPDRADVTMTAPFMRAYTELLVKTCHKRGAFAMGGMAAFIPSRKDPEVNDAAFAKVHADKTARGRRRLRRLLGGAPDLVPGLPGGVRRVLGDRPNQLDRQRDEVSVTPTSCSTSPRPAAQNTVAGLRGNLYVAVAYTAVWLSGNGAVAIHNLMEDAATAEISRAQVWQQIRNGAVLADTDEKVTKGLVRAHSRRGGRAAPNGR